MIQDIPLLSFLTFLPLIGAAFIILFIRGDAEIADLNARRCALWTSAATFLLSLALLIQFDENLLGFQLEEKKVWIEKSFIYYHLGVDGLSIAFIFLTTILVPICIIASWKSITERIKEYMVAFLILEGLIIGMFSALDLVVFYFFFEAILIPMYLIIGIWGGQNRVYAAFKFFLYTLIGSVLLLLGVIYIYQYANTTDYMLLLDVLPKLPRDIQLWLWLAFFASFAVKIPMWPVHTWLPDAHVQAPTAGSVILAAILLKMGAYGFLRFSLPFFPAASMYFAPFVFWLSVIAVIYASLVALMQSDMKKLVAYSSIAHMGFVTLGIFSFNVQAIHGAIFQMFSHGLTSAALFLGVGVLYDRMHTKEIDRFGGVVKKMPLFALYLMVFTMASIGLPGLSGFVGEFLVLAGLYQVDKLMTALAALGVILGAAYMLWMYWRVMFGEIEHKEVSNLNDLTLGEHLAFLPMLILTILLGIYPSILINVIDKPTITILHKVMGP